MTPKLILVAAALGALVLPLLASAAEGETADLRHLTAMLVTRASDDAFDQIDTKQDGFIDRLEASRYERVVAAFERIDRDGDGRISREEWSTATAGLLSLTFLRLGGAEDENP